MLEQGTFVYTITGQIKRQRINVKRRFKQFLSLRASLASKFMGLYIPPLPKKQLTNNLSESTAKTRTVLLQYFMNQMTKCPYLLHSLEFHLFLQEDVLQ